MLRAVAGGGGVAIGGAVTGGTAYRILHIDASGNLADSDNLKFGGAAAGTGLYLAAGTATTDVAAQSWTQTLNSAGTTFSGSLLLNVTATAKNAASNLLDFKVDGSSTFKFQPYLASTVGILTLSGQGASGYGAVAAATSIGMAIGTTEQFRIISGGGWSLLSTTNLGWSGSIPGLPSDVNISRISAGLIGVGTGAAGSVAGGLQAATYAQMGANAQAATVRSLTELTTIAAAATTDTTIQIPANAIVLAVSVRVTTVIPTAATFTVIGTTSSTAFNTAAVSTAATSTDKGTAAGAYVNTTAQTIRITPNLTPADNTGRVRVTIHFIEITAPTS